MRRCNIDLPRDVSFQITVHDEGDIWISETIARDCRWETLETEVVSRLLSCPVDFYDVGANIGWYSLMASRRLSSIGTVHAFEPALENALLLTRNIAQNSMTNVRINPYAVGASTTSGRIYFSRDQNKGDHRAYASTEARDFEEIGVVSLDDYLRYLQPRDLVVKVDSQGSEVDVLDGMTGVLASKSVNVALVMEFWPYGLDQRGTTCDCLIDKLSNAGFDCLMLTEGDSHLRRMTWPRLRELAATRFDVKTQHFTNIVAFKPDSPWSGTILADLLANE